MKLISLSPSKLNLYNESKQCFWDAYSPKGKAPRPRGIFPSLPGGMDLILKQYCDTFRGDMVPELRNKVTGLLFSDMEKLNRWRNWRTGLTVQSDKYGFKLIGAMDDCLIHDGRMIPLDFKTKGSEPKDDGSQYYQTQMDCYNYMLEKSGYLIENCAWLVYYYPKRVNLDLSVSDAVGIWFGYAPYKLKCDAGRVEELCAKAAELLRGPRPMGEEYDNEYYMYFQRKKSSEQRAREKQSQGELDVG